MSNSAGTLDATAGSWREDARVVGLVAFAHMLSHFFQLILAPLFPWIRAEFGFSYAELGFILTVLFGVSGFGQAAAGFVVDRFGALRTLVGGLLCLSAGAVVFAMSTSYGGFLAGAVLAGLGNSVFHPVDFWFLNHRVSLHRLGHAFSAHGLSGNLGWALAPVFLVGLATPFGWRAAILAAALLPLIAIALTLRQRAALRLAEAVAPRDSGRPVRSGDSVFAFLQLPSIWLCFGFFVCVAAALSAIQSFAPSILMTTYGMALASASMSITIYMLASAAGMIAGGWLVTRSRSLERNITIALALSVVAAVLIGARLLPVGYVLALMAVMGFGSGLAGPSRDMLIRSASPPGATGRVYGVVYSGLDAGIALGPLVFGKMLDHGYAAEVYFGIALCLFLGVLIAWRVAMLPALAVSAVRSHG